MGNPASWPRRRYSEAGAPFVRFAVFGPREVESLDLRDDALRIGTIPEGLTVQAVDPAGLQALLGQAMLTRLYAGTPAMQAARMAFAVTLIEGAPVAHATLDYLRDTIGIVTALAAQTGPKVAILDLNSFLLRTRDEWENAVFMAEMPRPARFAQIFVDETLEGSLVTTRGLRTFGRPDIAFPNVAHGWRDAAIKAVNALIEMAADGVAFDQGLTVDVPGVPERFVIAEGESPDDPLFGNGHVRIVQAT
ncbi:MAG: hypothetical protein AAFT19_04560 [Pseudomonadota bacterium]